MDITNHSQPDPSRTSQREDATQRGTSQRQAAPVVTRGTTTLPVLPRVKVVALVGNPNTGKTTLFNGITGLRQHVGNYPGATVEARSGPLRGSTPEVPIEVIDLPGAYSLSARSQDEAVVIDVLLGRMKGIAVPDVIVCVIDACNLSRNLFFVSQLLEIGRPVIAALNMQDLAAASGIRVDAGRLSAELGVPVVEVVATRQKGLDELQRAIIRTGADQTDRRCPSFPHCICAELDALQASFGGYEAPPADPAARMEAMQSLLVPGGFHEERMLQRCGRGLAEQLAGCRDRIAGAGESIVDVEARVRYAWIERVVQRVEVRAAQQRATWSRRVDRVVTNRIAGLGILILVMGIVFQSIYAWAGPLMDAVDSAVGAMGTWAARVIPPGPVESLVQDGLFAGVGAVLVFLPQILILFLFIAILEDCGYMARAAFLLDRWMRLVGLGGHSFIPLLSSFACAVPGIMAARTIADRYDRLVTILVAPLMSCSARLPVYVLLIGAFVPATPVAGGVMNLQALTLLAMYGAGTVVAFVVAWLVRRVLLKGKPQSFLLELPTYKWPSIRTVFYRMYGQGREFVVNAGTIIFAVTILIWALGYFPRPDVIAREHATGQAAVAQAHRARLEMIASELRPGMSVDELTGTAAVVDARADIEAWEREFKHNMLADNTLPDSPRWRRERSRLDQRIDRLVADRPDVGRAARACWQADQRLESALDQLGRETAGAYVGASYLGRMGRWIEPIVKPLGWDWRIGTAVIASFPAREVVVATLGAVYNLGKDTDEESVGLRERLRRASWPDGARVFNTAVALSIMVFFALCCQCASTLAVVKRETNSWVWPVVSFSYMTTLAYVGAWITYRVAMVFS